MTQGVIMKKRMKKKNELLKLVFILAILVVSMNIIAQTLPQPPSNYYDPDAGTEANPYLISNLANLRWLSETEEVWGDRIAGVVTKYYFSQTADIDATETIDWNDGKGFDTIGHIKRYENKIYTRRINENSTMV